MTNGREITPQNQALANPVFETQEGLIKKWHAAQADLKRALEVMSKLLTMDPTTKTKRDYPLLINEITTATAYGVYANNNTREMLRIVKALKKVV